MPLKLAIVGCGNIAGPYSQDIKKHPELELIGFYDLDARRSQAFAAEHGGKVYASLEALLADPEVEVVVNLTIFDAHYRVVKAGLEAGKHVYSEKPLALKYREAQELVDLAKAKNLRLACAPITFLGEAQQTAMKLVRDGKLGAVRAVYAEVNHGRIESWHPNPAPFYAVGPMLDVGVYPLALLTALFGPAKRLTAFATTLYPHRVTKEGQPFTIEAPDFYVVNLEFQQGPLVRLTANFYVSGQTLQGEGIEFHGDLGSLRLHNWFAANSLLEYADFNQPYAPIPPLRPSEVGIDWARGLVDYAQAIQTGRPPRVTGEHAAHVVEILEATNQSARTHQPVELTSSFTPPALMDWVDIKA
ncbi:oxidoreductase domain protein [Allomeiothermus silvanus DSM 9946]|uniref:Oxidoreductase domain protein n=1 Tax=Allomeiothermus silvanus (strain ATCC 700542 / DSM 9946 / NBRC 106475 / NCIMB 13440 / VI-R2) TaxID=526227 RepID=D7B9W4_ALLS1|nr:Gfo/Idh/MocA family oxidoreductase [Allomeiothermus silvanus]ADH62398.1 oxidoreductase domain protein [Allomeiothermus silvanus DSM 9946]